jgi:hypothetical protein
MDREELTAKELPSGGEIPDVTEEDIKPSTPDAAPYSINPDDIDADDKPEPESTSKPDATNEEEKVETKKEAPKKPEIASLSECFKYSPGHHKFAFNLGCFVAVLDGVFQPAYALLIGLALELFNPHQTEEEAEAIKSILVKFLIVVIICQTIFGWLQYSLL